MRKLNLTTYGVEEIVIREQKEINGGNPWAFVAGALIGGMLYDVYKAACKAMINAQIDHPEYYDGPVRSVR